MIRTAIRVAFFRRVRNTAQRVELWASLMMLPRTIRRIARQVERDVSSKARRWN